LFALVKVLLSLPSIIKGMKGIFGIFGLGKKKVQEEAIQTVNPKRSGKSNFSKAFDGAKGLGKITG
jgi:F0F1-type ATP synthase beta subunit